MENQLKDLIEIVKFNKPQFDELELQRQLDLCDTVLNYFSELKESLSSK